MHPLGLARPAGGGGGGAGGGGAAGGGGERTSEGSGGGGAVARLLALAEHLAEVEAKGSSWRKRQASRVAQARRVTLLSFEPADARVVLALDELRNAGSFERLFRAQAVRVRVRVRDRARVRVGLGLGLGVALPRASGPDRPLGITRYTTRSHTIRFHDPGSLTTQTYLYQAGHVPFGDEGLRAAWRSCFSMVLHGKCSAVC